MQIHDREVQEPLSAILVGGAAPWAPSWPRWGPCCPLPRHCFEERRISWVYLACPPHDQDLVLFSHIAPQSSLSVRMCNGYSLSQERSSCNVKTLLHRCIV